MKIEQKKIDKDSGKYMVIKRTKALCSTTQDVQYNMQNKYQIYNIYAKTC